MKLVMMGTGQFALPTFKSLLESEYEIVGLYTQPDRTGRGHHRHINPMKELAEEHNVPVFQPIKANADESIADLKSLNADLCVVAAYGQILSAELLQTPRLGAINLHASLLPKYRGAAPIQWAVWKGETETGVTLFQIEPKLDAGPVWGVVKTPIGKQETYGELQDRLAELSIALTLEVLEKIESGTATPIVQDASQVTQAPRLKKSDGEIDWNQNACEINSHVRAMQPWPKPTSTLQISGRKSLSVQILKTTLQKEASTVEAASGSIVSVSGDQLLVQVGDNQTLSIDLLQPAGKKPIPIAEFIRGYQPKLGDQFVS